METMASKLVFQLKITTLVFNQQWLCNRFNLLLKYLSILFKIKFSKFLNKLTSHNLHTDLSTHHRAKWNFIIQILFKKIVFTLQWKQHWWLHKYRTLLILGINHLDRLTKCLQWFKTLCIKFKLRILSVSLIFSQSPMLGFNSFMDDLLL